MVLPIGVVICRTYAGSRQRKQGAWSWFAMTVGGTEMFGSYQTVTELLRARNLRFEDEDVGVLGTLVGDVTTHLYGGSRPKGDME
jgi:hypothetical protein